MEDRDYRAEPDYRPFLRAVRRRMRGGMDAFQAIDATIRTPRFRWRVRLEYVRPVLKDVERRAERQKGLYIVLSK
jgi:hypothetical protein